MKKSAMDKKQSRLRDVRSGTYEPTGRSDLPDEEDSRHTEHQRLQAGADVREARPKIRHKVKPNLPEGLKRKPMPPYSRKAGRGND
jgi:hypothetical protein